MKTLKQQHQELFNHLDISPALKTIIFEGVIKNEIKWLTQKRQELRLEDTPLRFLKTTEPDAVANYIETILLEELDAVA